MGLRSEGDISLDSWEPSRLKVVSRGRPTPTFHSGEATREIVVAGWCSCFCYYAYQQGHSCDIEWSEYLHTADIMLSSAARVGTAPVETNSSFNSNSMLYPSTLLTRQLSCSNNVVSARSLHHRVQLNPQGSIAIYD